MFSVKKRINSLLCKVKSTTSFTSQKIVPSEIYSQDGSTLFDKGWLQGKIVPNNKLQLPDKIVKNAANEHLLIVCSQSCSVVSRNFEKDPYVEIIVGKPIVIYNPKSQEARGKDQRKLHLNLEVHGESKPFEINIYDRFEIDRKLLLTCDPVNDVYLKPEDGDKLSNWIARSYLRLALPNELVAKITERKGFIDKFDRWLKQVSNTTGHNRHEFVKAIYLKWEPNNASAQYTVDIMLLADCADFQKDFDLNFEEQVLNKIDFDALGLLGFNVRCQLRDETFLTDLDGYKRFSEFDYLTEMGEWRDLLA